MIKVRVWDSEMGEERETACVYVATDAEDGIEEYVKEAIHSDPEWASHFSNGQELYYMIDEPGQGEVRKAIVQLDWTPDIHVFLKGKKQ